MFTAGYTLLDKPAISFVNASGLAHPANKPYNVLSTANLKRLQGSSMQSLFKPGKECLLAKIGAKDTPL